MVTVNSNNSSSSNSTQLVETVSIDYDDFNDTFLTCATCLCVYDSVERAPKLLPCSHTVCVHCLTRIVASANNRRTIDTLSNSGRNSASSNIIQTQQQQDSQTVQQQRQNFRCPICRELINVPQNGGVLSLPPSFLVNQLLDLISTHRRRTLIPTCNGEGLLSSHINQELLYCESCDEVFCSVCTKHDTEAGRNNHIPSKSSSLEHIIIPVSVAMKRTSEIMLYKTNEYVANLNCSMDGIRTELKHLDTARNECITSLDAKFSDLMIILENHKQQLKKQIYNAYDSKHKILNQQLSNIKIEKTKVMEEFGDSHQLLDIHSINQRIKILNEHLQSSTGGIHEPCENAFIALNLDTTSIKSDINNAFSQQHVRTTSTCPGLCILNVVESNGENLLISRMVDTQIATLTAIDHDGNKRNIGGDPVSVKLIGPFNKDEEISNLSCQEPSCNDNVRVIDHKNGLYTIRLILLFCGRYRLHVYILGRPVSFNKSRHIDFSIIKNINPISQYNKRPLLQQPSAIAVDPDKARVYVLDTGNCRIRILDTNLNYICDVPYNNALQGRSSTGIGLLNDETLITVNWRDNTITQMTLEGKTVKIWTHPNIIEPMCIALDRDCDILLIGDSMCNIYAFKASTGEYLFMIKNNNSDEKSAEFIGTFMAIGPSSQIIVISSKLKKGCRSLDIYSCKGIFERSFTITSADKCTQSYSSLIACNNFILATRRHYNAYVIDLIDIQTEKLINTVDSNAFKLRRPTGMVAFTEFQDTAIDKISQHLSYYLLVTDVADNCVNKYHVF